MQPVRRVVPESQMEQGVPDEKNINGCHPDTHIWGQKNEKQCKIQRNMQQGKHSISVVTTQRFQPREHFPLLVVHSVHFVRQKKR